MIAAIPIKDIDHNNQKEQTFNNSEWIVSKYNKWEIFLFLKQYIWYDIYALDPKPAGKNEKSEALTSKNADILDETSLHSTKEQQFLLLLWNYTNDVQNNTENTLIQNFTLCRLLINGHFSNVWNEAYPHTMCSGEILTELCVCIFQLLLFKDY